jgi:hypothetical protein
MGENDLFLHSTHSPARNRKKSQSNHVSNSDAAIGILNMATAHSADYDGNRNPCATWLQ